MDGRRGWPVGAGLQGSSAEHRCWRRAGGGGRAAEVPVQGVGARGPGRLGGMSSAGLGQAGRGDCGRLGLAHGVSPPRGGAVRVGRPRQHRR